MGVNKLQTTGISGNKQVMAHQPKKQEWNIHRFRSAKTAAKKTLQGKISQISNLSS